MILRMIKAISQCSSKNFDAQKGDKTIKIKVVQLVAALNVL